MVYIVYGDVTGLSEKTIGCNNASIDIYLKHV